MNSCHKCQLLASPHELRYCTKVFTLLQSLGCASSVLCDSRDAKVAPELLCCEALGLAGKLRSSTKVRVVAVSWPRLLRT